MRDGEGVVVMHNCNTYVANAEYGSEFIAAVERGNVQATQFHPEKSGLTGLNIVQSFLDPDWKEGDARDRCDRGPKGLAKRVIACLDVRANDQGDLVVTKGDQYDVRESGRK